MNIKILNNKLFVYIFFLIISFLIRYYLFEGRESWHDEWHSIYVANPNFNNAETFMAYYGDKGDTFLTEFYPPLYIFILKYVFIIFGYIDDNGRWFSIISGTLVVPLSIYFANLFLDIKKTFFIGIVLTFNLFLIWQSLEIRAHSFLVFLALINIILFYKLLEKKKKIYFFSYGIISIFLLSLWPIAGVIFFGKTIYLIKKFLINKTFEKKIFILFFFILFIYFIFNIDYLKLNLSRDWHYTQLYSTFFYNYHFRTFFGSPVLGAFYLLLFSFLLIKNIKLDSRENLKTYKEKEDIKIKQWTRSEVIKDYRFYIVSLNTLAMPWIITGIFVYQSFITDSKMWNVYTIPKAFMIYSITSIITLFSSGFLVDKFTSRKLIPIMNIPLLLAMIVLFYYQNEIYAYLFLGLIGVSNGFGNVLGSSTWAEIYGVKYIGSIKALTTAFMVFATAFGTAVFGILIDNDFTIENIAFVAGAYIVISLILLMTFRKTLEPVKLLN